MSSLLLANTTFFFLWENNIKMFAGRTLFISSLKMFLTDIFAFFSVGTVITHAHAHAKVGIPLTRMPEWIFNLNSVNHGRCNLVYILSSKLFLPLCAWVMDFV